MRMLVVLMLGVVGVLAVHCDDDGDGDGDADADGDGDGDGDGDADSDGDGDGDGDVDSDGDGDGDGDSGLGRCPSGFDCEEERDQLMDLLAAHRAEACPDAPLTRDPNLDAVAMDRSEAMASQGVHSPTGLAHLRDRLLIHGFDLDLDYVAEENVGDHSSITGMEEMFWNYEDPDDPGTFPMRDRISDCDFVFVGIGIAADLEGTYWGTQTFFTP